MAECASSYSYRYSCLHRPKHPLAFLRPMRRSSPPRGRFSVGVRTLELHHADQPDILHFDAATGKAPLYNRPLTVEVWYPATIPAGQVESTVYTMAAFSHDAPAPGAATTPLDIPGKALRDAPPLPGSRFPLVVVSHGYPGSRMFLTYLTENLASKGYVVSAIDHTDSVLGHVAAFPSTLLNRSADQLFTIDSLRQLALQNNHFLHGLVDTEQIAIVGYSMGGYGALISAGAGIDPSSALQKFVPGQALAPWSLGSPQFKAIDRRAIKAIVAIAPWGNQPPYSAWNADSLAAIHIPSFFIAGDHDDVADFTHGIEPAFEAATNSQRWLLVYKEARHNTGGNPPPTNTSLDYSALQFFEEPVWRKDRITSINQHFVTAFLDLYLKNDVSRRAYLDVSPEDSDQAVWKLPEGTRDQGAFSSGKDAQGHPYWTGFQNRSALGLRLIRRGSTP